VQIEHQARHHRDGHAADGAVSGVPRAQGRTGANGTHLLAKLERQLTRRGCSGRDVSGWDLERDVRGGRTHFGDLGDVSRGQEY
jgi:hypothetical protein